MLSNDFNLVVALSCDARPGPGREAIKSVGALMRLGAPGVHGVPWGPMGPEGAKAWPKSIWDDYSQHMEKKKHVPNRQPAMENWFYTEKT